MLSIDLQNAYLHVPVLPPLLKYPGFAVGHIHLQFLSLPIRPLHITKGLYEDPNCYHNPSKRIRTLKYTTTGVTFVPGEESSPISGTEQYSILPASKVKSTIRQMKGVSVTSYLWALNCLSLIGQMLSCITTVLAFETFPARVFEATEQTVSISTHTPDDPDAQESTLVAEEMHAYEITSIRTCQLDHNYY